LIISLQWEEKHSSAVACEATWNGRLVLSLLQCEFLSCFGAGIRL